MSYAGGFIVIRLLPVVFACVTSHCCISVALVDYHSTEPHTRRLSETLWRAQRVDLLEKLCSFLTSPTSTTATQKQLDSSSYQPRDSHQTQTPAPPLFNQKPLIPHSMTSDPCDLRPSTALTTDLPVFNTLSQSPSPPPSNYSSKPRHYPSPGGSSGSRGQAARLWSWLRREKRQLHSYGSYLRSRYQAQVPSFALQWPPPPSTKIFNLAMIKKERVQRGRIDEEFVRLTMTGKVNVILDNKVPVKLEEIFQLDQKKRKMILIEGAPGSGKSTLSWDICQRWGAGKLFQEFEAVVLVRVRDPEAQKACEIVELLPAEDRSMAESVAAEIVACRGRKVLFVIDGWDEGGSSLPETSPISRLIQSKLCCGSSVIVTSRPIASGDLQPLVSSRIEIVGFTPAELRQYFSECLEGDCRAVDKLLEKIQEHPEVEGSCYLPLNAAIIVHLFLSEGQTIPSTQYEIFSAVVLNCILRHLKHRTEEGRQIRCLESIFSLPEAIREPFENVCRLAYHGVVKKKVAFSQDDFSAVDIPTGAPLLGLLQAVDSLVSTGRRVSFNFIHLSIQELLAAFSISQLPPSQQISVFEKLFDKPRFRAVFQFYSAITKLQNPAIRSIVTRIVRNELQYSSYKCYSHHQYPLLVSLLNCLFEAQDPSLCQFVAEQLNGYLDLSSTTLTPLDCLAVGFFLSCVCVTTRSEFRVDLQVCSIDDHKCRFLTRCLCECPVPNSTATGCLHMNLQGNDIRERGAQHIADVLQNTSIVHTLCLGSDGVFGITIPECGLKCILESLLTNCSLVTLQLHGNYFPDNILTITQESGPVLCQVLHRNKTLTELDFSRNSGVSDTGAFFIAEGLKLNTSLRALRLSQCGISAEGAKLISGALEINTSLRIMDLARNELDDTGVGYLANVLKQNDSLKELYLGKCGMTDRGLELLVIALTLNKSIQVLDLCGNDGISVGGLSVLTEHLKRNIGLVDLHLPLHLLFTSWQLDSVNEARRRSALPLIKCNVSHQLFPLFITSCSG